MCFLWETEKERGIATAEVEGAVLRAKGGSECTLSISNSGVGTGKQDRPYGDRLSPMGEVLLRSALINAAGGDVGKVNSTKPFQGLPIFFHKLKPNSTPLLYLITGLLDCLDLLFFCSTTQ